MISHIMYRPWNSLIFVEVLSKYYRTTLVTRSLERPLSLYTHAYDIATPRYQDQQWGPDLVLFDPVAFGRSALSTLTTFQNSYRLYSMTY